MNKKFLQLFLSVCFIITGFFFVSIDKTEAACVVTSANFRANNFTPTFWYLAANPPYVYIDFVTTGCVGNSFELSITEYDVTEDVIEDGGLIVTSGFGAIAMQDDDDLVSVADNRVVQPPTDNFTIAFRVGESECEDISDPDCNYYIRINDSVLGGATDIQLTSNLRYNCEGSCSDSNAWQFVAILQTYQGTHPNDTAGNNTSGNGTGGTGTTGGGGITGVTSVNVNLQNPIGDNTMTLYDFIKKVIDFAIKIGIPIVAIAIIYSGLLFVTARGNDKQLETAKNAFTYAVIGGAVLLGSWIFAQLIKDTIESITMVMIYFA